MANPFSSFVSSLLPQKSSTSLSGGSSVMTPLQQFQSQAGASKVQYPTTPKANATSVTTKQPTYIPSNSGATSTAPAQITPAKTSVSSPAAQSYVSSLTSSQPSYSSTAYTPPTATQTPTYQATTETPKESNPYLDYLKSSFNPDALNKAQETIKGYDTKLGTETQRLADINSNIFGKTTAARHEYEKMLDTPGGTREGAQVSATQEGRRNNAELADLATQQNAQANSVNALTDARKLASDTYDQLIKNGATVYEAEQGAQNAFTLSNGETRYDAQGNVIAQGGGGDGQDNTLLSPTEAQTLGVPYGTTRSQAASQGITPQKALTESQARDLTYGQRGQSAMQVIDSLESTIAKYNPATFALQTAIEPNAIGNTAVSPEIRQIRQAERDFLTAILRRESGASISPSEFATGEKQYFPQPGDDAKTLAQKAKTRETAINSFLQNAGQGTGGTSTGSSASGGSIWNF